LPRAPRKEKSLRGQRLDSICTYKNLPKKERSEIDRKKKTKPDKKSEYEGQTWGREQKEKRMPYMEGP